MKADPVRRAVSSLPLRSFLLLAVAALVPGAVRGQSELVIYKEGTNQYHRAGCELIRSGDGVIALTRAQAEARGYKPHPDCDPDARKPAAADGSTAIDRRAAPAVDPTVYLNGTKYYHRKDCRRLEANPKAVQAETLDKAGKSFWPCPDCRPPVRKRSAAPAVGRGR
jgi:hypothetical protein